MTDQQQDLSPLYATAGKVLTWGFRISAALLTIGLVLAFAKDEDLSTEAEPLAELFDLLMDGKSTALVDMAILAMILTPVAAVLAVALGFYRLRDRRYAFASAFVLAILGISIAISLLR